MKKIIYLLLILSAAVVSCSKLTDPNTTPTQHDRLQALLLGKDTLDMYVGETRQVPLTLSPSNYHIDSIKWSSSDTTVLSISVTGSVKAKKVGTSTVTVSNLTNTISVNCLVSVVPAPVDSLKRGLLAYYPFNNNAVDSSGNGNNGAVIGATPTTNRFGTANSAYYFDGVSSYISVKDNNALRLGFTDFTINTWVNITSYNASYGSIVIDKRGPGSTNGWNFGIAGYGDLTNYIGAVGVPTYSVSGGTDPYIKGITVIDSNQWHMITTVYSASKMQVSIYVDGKLDNTANNIPSPNPQSNADVYIGRDNPSVSNLNGYYFKGKIDDIRLYDRMLSVSEIKKLFNLTH